MGNKESNCILQETLTLVETMLGEEIDTLTVERAVLGLFFSGVKLSNGFGGVCYTPTKDIPEAVCCPSSAKAMPLSGKLTQRPVRQYLQDLFGDNVLRKILGVAVLNALSAFCWTRMSEKPYSLETGCDAFDDVVLNPGQKAVVVGALAPMLRWLLKENADFRVLEQDPATLKDWEMPYYAPPEDAVHYVPEADVLVITGTTLINDTLEGLLEMAKPGAQIVVTGPTASMLPDAFFKRGVTSLGGILVQKPDELLDIISEGGSGYHFFGKRQIGWL